MRGLIFDFDSGDLEITASGFTASTIDSQNAALIALTQICRITRPEIGTQLASLLQNRRETDIAPALAAARRAVEADGGTNVVIDIVDGELFFRAKYP